MPAVSMSSALVLLLLAPLLGVATVLSWVGFGTLLLLLLLSLSLYAARTGPRFGVQCAWPSSDRLKGDCEGDCEGVCEDVCDGEGE